MTTEEFDVPFAILPKLFFNGKAFAVDKRGFPISIFHPYMRIPMELADIMHH